MNLIPGVGIQTPSLNSAMIEQKAAQIPTLYERLVEQREALATQLNLVEEALSALESNPDVAAAVNAISRLGGYI